jgi:hypothetical protein
VREDPQDRVGIVDKDTREILTERKEKCTSIKRTQPSENING